MAIERPGAKVEIEGELRLSADWHQFAEIAGEDIPVLIARELLILSDREKPASSDFRLSGQWRLTLEKINEETT